MNNIFNFLYFFKYNHNKEYIKKQLKMLLQYRKSFDNESEINQNYKLEYFIHQDFLQNYYNL